MLKALFLDMYLDYCSQVAFHGEVPLGYAEWFKAWMKRKLEG